MKLSEDLQEQYESEIQSQILQYLQLLNCVVKRNNTGAVNRGGRLVRYGEPGSPDIEVVSPPDGRYIGLEVKRPRGRLSAIQKQYQQRIREVGGVYEKVTSVDDVKKVMEGLYRRSAGTAGGRFR